MLVSGLLPTRQKAAATPTLLVWMVMVSRAVVEEALRIEPPPRTTLKRTGWPWMRLPLMSFTTTLAVYSS